MKFKNIKLKALGILAISSFGLSAYGLDLNEYVEVDTGMGRTGIQISEFGEMCTLINTNSYITVEGVFTHFSCADIHTN